MDDMIEVTLRLNAKLARSLCEARSKNFYLDQPERFELIGEYDLPLPNDPVFLNGTMAWCATASDLFLFAAFEQSAGYATTLLWDLDRAGVNLEQVGGPIQSCRVVLSSRVLEYD